MTTRFAFASTLLLPLLGCGDELVEVIPTCDGIGWPLDVTPVTTPPAPDFDVECADGWGSDAATRPALATTTLPNGIWTSAPHPDGGWLLLSLPANYPTWGPWFEAQGVDFDSIAANFVLVWVREDGSLGWVLPEFAVWDLELDNGRIWVLGTDAASSSSLVVIDAGSGAVLDQRAWDIGPGFNQFGPAPDPAGGVWITTIENHAQDKLVDQSLYRATNVDAVELVAVRTTTAPGQIPSGAVRGLPDGAAAWRTATVFELIETDGTVRWTRAQGFPSAASGDTMLVTATVPTGVGAGGAMQLEQVRADDGTTIWSRSHQRFVPSDPGACSPDGCALHDGGGAYLRPDGGYLVAGYHAYPSARCPSQPLVMAISESGELEWAHRVETCGFAFGAASRDDGVLEIFGVTMNEDWNGQSGTWTRSFAP